MARMDDLTLVDYTALAPGTIGEVCQAAMDECDAAIAAVVSIPDSERTFANTMLALEQAGDDLSTISSAYTFMAYVHSDEAMRSAAHEWEQKLDTYSIGLAFREDLYEAVRAFAGSDEAKALTGEDARLLERELRDYRRNGFEPGKDERDHLRELFDRLVALGVDFRKAIDEWDDGIVVSRNELAGLPDSYIDGLTTVEESGETRYRVSLDYPEIFPFMANAESAARRRELFEKDQCKGGAENVKRLEEAIQVRNEIATILGYDSWAAYAIEVRMARTRETVDAFLADLRTKVEIKARSDMDGLREASKAHRGTGQVEIWDWRFYHNYLMKTQYAVDEFEVAKYFPLQACIDGLFDVEQTLLGVRFEPRPDVQRWHEDVQAFDVYDAGGDEPVARFYMDLFPRPNKYGHAAAFTLRRGRLLADGSYQKPVSAIVANFTKPTASQPSLLRHSEVVTFFHEFGHIMHQTLTKARRARFSGTATERDFVEAPSQMLEHWVWEPQVLASFARHHQTGEPLPSDLIDAMVAAKNLDSGVMTLRQLLFATLDMAYHSPGFDGDTTTTLRDLHAISGFPFPEGTHFQSGFGHLFGYDAGYYGYLWSHVFGDDMYTRFEAAGPLDAATGAAYRQSVLERGGTVDGQELVHGFLGREPNNEAFLRGLGLES